MARFPRTWMERLAASVEAQHDPGTWRGRRLGLPPEGPGSVGSIGRRVVAFAVDATASALIAAIVIPDAVDPRRNLLSVGVLAAIYLLVASLTGYTLGMRLLGLRLVRLADRAQPPGLLPVAVRTALLVLLVPALVGDRDGRGLHDRAAGTVVLRA